MSVRRKEIRVAQDAAELRRAIAPLVEFVFQRTDQVIAEIRLCLRLQEFAPIIEERTWQKALACLALQRRIIENNCGKLRKTFQKLRDRSRILGAVWQWEERYLDILDDLEDVAETIALGLNADALADLKERDRQTRTA
jgi:hypothetical protein